MIPYGRQSISEQDIQAVVDILRSDFLTQGPTVPRFEQAVCDYTGSAHAVAVNSGTSALHLACKALGLSEGDWLWTTPITFVASANCGLYCGARVDFVDIDPVTWNLSADRLREKLERAKKRNCLPRIVVVVHFGGFPCDMKSIGSLSREYGFSVIEDASHAIGGRYESGPIGDCRYSDMAIFSFHPVKTITTGEGGMAVTNSAVLAEKMTLLRSHGITRDPSLMSREPDGPWYYEQLDLGFNYRMTDIEAALGISQLRRLDEFVRRRHEIAASYDELLQGLPIQLPPRAKDKYSGMHLYVIRIREKSTSELRRQVFDMLREQCIGVNVHYIPVHTQPYYKKMGFREQDFPSAMQYYREAVSLPMHVNLADEDIAKITSRVKKALQ